MSVSFDLNRAIIRPEPAVPPLRNPALLPIAQAVPLFELTEATPLLKTTVAGRTLVFNTLHLLYFHVSQGLLEEQPWMVSFCLICNAGACFVPKLAGSVHHFSERGLYNAMTLLADEETGSLWNHLTGEAMYGPLAGQQLEILDVLQHMNLKQALTVVPEAFYVASELTLEESQQAQEWDDFRRTPYPDLSQRTLNTLGQEDTRLPRFEAGLGVWTATARRFYPYTALNLADNVVFDRLDGRRIVVYVDPESSNPTAFFSQATWGEWRGDVLHLNSNERLRNGALYDRHGERVQVTYPSQLFQRWYSFSVLFPGAAIFGRDGA
jgi:hypothetical protein